MPRPGSPPVCGRCRDWPERLTAVAAVAYRGPVPELVGLLKYRGWRHLAETCGLWMAAAVQRSGAEPTLIVPVPLHAVRRRERGFDQALLLAEAVAGRLGRPVQRALERRRATRPQVGLGRDRRLANVRGAFAALARVDASRIALVDDVATSGATLVAAATALLAAGASEVVGVTFALALDDAPR